MLFLKTVLFKRNKFFGGINIMASIVKRNKSYAVVYTDTTGEKKRQKWETYYSLEEAQQRKGLLELCLNIRTEVRRQCVQTVEQFFVQYVELYGVEARHTLLVACSFPPL